MVGGLVIVMWIIAPIMCTGPWLSNPPNTADGS